MKLAAAWTIVVLATTQTDTAPPFWQALTRGPHQVGFTVAYRHDYSRIWRTTAQDPGVEGARPIRISIWYPATAGGRAMAYRDYNALPAPPAVFGEIDRLFAKRNEQTPATVVPDAKSRESLMDAAVAARFDAPRAAGRFPLIVDGSGLNETWQHPLQERAAAKVKRFAPK